MKEARQAHKPIRLSRFFVLPLRGEGGKAAFFN